jgi:putative Holliday junction resolvase
VSRYLGIDLGERRIGLAVAEEDGLAVRPLATVRRGADMAADVANLRRVVADQRIGELVVGLPLEANGDEGPMAAATRAWAAEVSERLGLPVALRDERLSSHVAAQRLGPPKRGRDGGPPGRARRDAHRARIDREAAAIILADELDARRDASSTISASQPTEEST